MPATDVPILDVSAIEAAFDRHVSSLGADEAALARRTLDRVRPPNWTLEWHLPWWLGLALEVRPETLTRIVTSNVLGLVAVRLEDDGIDGELTGEDLVAARHLSAALLHAAIGAYRPLFPSTSRFWADLDRSLADWRSSHHGQPGGAVAGRSISQRGAPLKVGARAICLLADRPAAWPVVEACVDHALDALASYDDLCDWEADLDAARWNGFIASVAPGPQDLASRARNRSAVLVALMTRPAASRGFGHVAAEARIAARLARDLGSAPLANHLESVATRSVRQGRDVEAHYIGAADRATTLIFGAALHGGTG